MNLVRRILGTQERPTEVVKRGRISRAEYRIKYQEASAGEARARFQANTRGRILDSHERVMAVQRTQISELQAALTILAHISTGHLKSASREKIARRIMHDGGPGSAIAAATVCEVES